MRCSFQSRHTVQQPSHAELRAVSKHVSNQFSEQDILSWHDEFLTNGFHYITLDSVATGRIFVDTFLRSLNYYHDIGSLTLSEQTLDSSVDDLYDILARFGYLQQSNLINFFVDEWCYDFVWIEITDNLLHTPWFYEFTHLLNDFNISQTTPIFMITYD